MLGTSASFRVVTVVACGAAAPRSAWFSEPTSRHGQDGACGAWTHEGQDAQELIPLLFGVNKFEMVASLAERDDDHGRAGGLHPSTQ